MIVIKNIDKIELDIKTVVTIGNFDGVHAGHRDVISEVVKKANKNKLKSVVVTFVPHTQAAFAIGKNYKTITTTLEKTLLIEELGVDILVLLKFNKSIWSLKPKEFLNSVIINNLKPAEIIFGYDHRFGKGRDGNYNMLKEFCLEKNIKTKKMKAYKNDQKIISSTLIRELIDLGKVEIANELLGKPYIISGIVEHGFGIGKELGFPTANLKIAKEKRLLPDGVYGVRVLIKNKLCNAILSLGNRPTFDGIKQCTEVFIPNFDGNLYGKRLVLQIIYFVREQKKFKTVDLLKENIKKDIININKKLN